MENIFEQELSRLKNKKYVDKKTYRGFLQRLSKGKLTRNLNPTDHFCTFIVPFDKKTNQIFIGHHVNADQWLPPGGHIEQNESPVDTVKREFDEELGIKPDDNQIELFDLGITDVQGKKRPCKVHYDLWYLVYTPKISFQFARKEFYKAGWFTIETAGEKASHKSVINSLNNLKKIINRL